MGGAFPKMTNNPSKLWVMLTHACILCGEGFLPLLQGLNTSQTKKNTLQTKKIKMHSTEETL